jgi:hypothetical protein
MPLSGWLMGSGDGWLENSISFIANWVYYGNTDTVRWHWKLCNACNYATDKRRPAIDTSSKDLLVEWLTDWAPGLWAQVAQFIFFTYVSCGYAVQYALT